MKFIDEIKVRVSAGHGGSGRVGWRREKYVPMGGPNGGDGGNGGCVIFATDPGINTLIDFAFSPEIDAADGEGGGQNQCNGRNGEDDVRRVPVGTQVYHEGELVADLNVPGARWIAARGGRGGKGNAHFRSSTFQAPDFAQPGEPGEAFEFLLSLKSVADVGLIGLPNVGKSTLISRISAARPKVANYPFTTLNPNLGVVALKDGARFVVADIPGLIPGAHTGKGLGIKFLKHVERTSLLVQLIDVTTTWEDEALANPADSTVWVDAARKQYELLDHELRCFSPALAKLPRIVAFSKGELPENQQAFSTLQHEFETRGIRAFLISSVTGLGIDALLYTLAEQVAATRQGFENETTMGKDSEIRQIRTSDYSN